jgi:hypothetical protein
MSIDLDPQTVTRPPGVPAPAAAAPVSTPEPPRMPGRRNPKWIALGIVALCLGGLLSYAVYAKVATESSVVAIKQTVYRGELIQADDLTRIVIQGDAFPNAIPASRMAEVVDRRATFDLPVGSIVSAESVTDATIPQPGRAVVGLRLASGQAPAALLLPSSPVRLVALPPAGAEAGGADKLAGKTYLAHVIDQAVDADGTSILVNVEVAAEQAPTIALLAAQSRVAVVRDPGN